jgi:hypothetical protein
MPQFGRSQPVEAKVTRDAQELPRSMLPTSRKAVA